MDILPAHGRRQGGSTPNEAMKSPMIHAAAAPMDDSPGFDIRFTRAKGRMTSVRSSGSHFFFSSSFAVSRSSIARFTE
jgi:hypothetical protein